jgi:ammonium transporter, Amt family
MPNSSSAAQKLRRRAVIGGVVTAALVLGLSGAAGAQSDAFDAKAATDALGIDMNVLWVVIGAVLVIFMQAGFALVETGFCRARHSAHVVSTNFAIFGLGFVAFFLIGYPIMFGGFGTALLDFQAPGSALIGSGNWVFLWKGPIALAGHSSTAGLAAFFLYMVAFMDTTATIPTGGMAERWKWKAFVGWGLFCGAIYYPLFGAWTWGGGWLASLGKSASLGFGYVDFAGSGVVHAMGGIAALTGAYVLGPRIGKFDRDGKPRALPGHHIPMAMLGTFILLFGWFGFNAASTFAVTDTRFALVAANTAIAAAFGATIGMAWIWRRSGKPDPGMMINGMLAGLVAITAPCAFVEPWAAMVIGSIAGVIVVESVFFIERRFKIDDPVGAISVHGVCGVWGLLSVGIFANGQYGQGWNGMLDAAGNPATLAGKGVVGILYSGQGWGQLASQVLGALTIIVVMGGISLAFFKIQNMVMKGGIRVDRDTELEGVDIPEMGVLGYPEFMGAAASSYPSDGGSRSTTDAGSKESVQV